MKAYHSQRLLEERQAEQLARALPPRQQLQPIAPAAIAAPEGTTQNPRRALKICVECEAHSWRFSWITGRTLHRCHEPLLRDPVTGAPTNPELNRRKGGGCGPGAGHWRPKPAAPAARPREIVVLPDTEPEEYLPPVPVRMLVAPRDEVIAVLYEHIEEVP